MSLGIFTSPNEPDLRSGFLAAKPKGDESGLLQTEPTMIPQSGVDAENDSTKYYSQSLVI